MHEHPGEPRRTSLGRGAARHRRRRTSALLDVVRHFDRHLLPNRIVLPAAAIVLAAQLIFFPEHWLAWLGASLGAAALFAGARLFYPAGLGMGDVKLALLLGAVLGTAVLSALTLGTFVAGVFGLVLIARGGAAARKTAIPFGPFLGFGAIVVLLFG